MVQHPISKHVFFFPFMWEEKRIIKTRLVTQHQTMKTEARIQLAGWDQVDTCAQAERAYNERVYFYKPVQSMLYEKEQGGTSVYCYEKKTQQGADCVTLKSGHKTYMLGLSEVQLNLYKTGIALLRLTLLNTKYEDAAAVQAINGLAKSIYPYRLPITVAQQDYFPEQVAIQLQGQCYTEVWDKNYLEHPMCIADFMMALLGADFATHKGGSQKGRFYIEPLLSNRMFVLCQYENKDLLAKCQDSDECQILLNPFVTISKQQKGMSCMVLSGDEAVYGVGRFVLMQLVAKQEERSLYDKLVTLVIVQRATLLGFSNKLADISGFDKEKLVGGISTLYEIYVQFINQMYFDEVTVDVQGTRIYDALFTQLKIQAALKELDFEMREVHEYSSLIQRRQSQIRMDLLTIVGAILVIPTFVTGFFGMNVLEDRFVGWWHYADVGLFLNAYVLLPIQSVLFIYCWCTKSQRYYKWWLFFLGGCSMISLCIFMIGGCGLG